MPIPKPKSDENEKDFMSRCMGDPIMQEYGQDQRAAICYKQARKSEVLKKINKGIQSLREHIEKVELVEKYKGEIEEIYKAKTVDGFLSPEPGDLPEAGENLLARVYSKCRADGGDKEKCAKIAWTAVNNAGYKSSVQTLLRKAYTQLFEIVQKKEGIK